MSKTVKYIGSQQRWPELSTTGKQSTWLPGQTEERSDAEAAQLKATGLFSDISSIQLSASKVAALSSIASRIGTQQRVFLLGDSQTMRNFRAFGAASASVSGTDLTISVPSGSALPPIGSYVRIINETDAAVNIDVPVVSCTATTVVVRYPFDVTGRVSATVGGAFYAIGGDTGYWNYAEAELAALGYPIEVVRSAGDGGDTLYQIRQRIETEIAPYAVPGDIVVFMGGVNGAGSTANNTPDATTKLDQCTASNVVRELGAIFDRLLELGVTVHASTITQAQASTYWDTSPSVGLANTIEANGYIRGRALSERFLRCFDSWMALGSGSYASSDIESAGIHFLVSGAEKVGQRYVDDCLADYRKGSYRRVLSTSDAYVNSSSWNLLTNPSFAGATGTTAPTGWTASLGGGTNSLTLAARSDGIGNDLTIAKSHTSANAATLSQDITARLSAGNRIVFGSEYETGAGSEGHYFSISLEVDVGGVTYSYRIGNNYFSYAQGGRMPPTGVRRFFEIYNAVNLGGRIGVVIPAGFTAARFIYRLQLGASGSCAAVVSRPQVYRIA